MPLPQEKSYTYADILAWDDGQRYELYGGQVVALASPSNIHQLISFEIGRQLGNFLVGKTCKVYPAPFDVRLFDTAEDRPENSEYVLQPDIIVVCDKTKVDKFGVHGAPDLVIEVLSPSTRSNDRLKKYYLYEQAGVREYWIVDPETRSVAVYTLNGGRYAAADFYIAGATVPVNILDGCSIDLSSVFPE